MTWVRWWCIKIQEVFGRKNLAVMDKGSTFLAMNNVVHKAVRDSAVEPLLISSRNIKKTGRL
jgi:hypothetical protein